MAYFKINEVKHVPYDSNKEDVTLNMWNNSQVLETLKALLIPQTSLLSFKIKYVVLDIRKVDNIHAALKKVKI